MESGKKLKAPTTSRQPTRNGQELPTRSIPTLTILAANYFPAILPSPGNTESKKVFLIPNWNNRDKGKKETLAKTRNQNKEKKIPHIRAGYQDPKPKRKLIRPTIQVKNLTCLLTRVMFQESRRPSTMQSKQCRHFQRRLISKPLTLNRSLKPFLPPFPQRFALRRDSWY